MSWLELNCIKFLLSGSFVSMLFRPCSRFSEFLVTFPCLKAFFLLFSTKSYSVYWPCLAIIRIDLAFSFILWKGCPPSLSYCRMLLWLWYCYWREDCLWCWLGELGWLIWSLWGCSRDETLYEWFYGCFWATCLYLRVSNRWERCCSWAWNCFEFGDLLENPPWETALWEMTSC